MVLCIAVSDKKYKELMAETLKPKNFSQKVKKWNSQNVYTTQENRQNKKGDKE